MFQFLRSLLRISEKKYELAIPVSNGNLHYTADPEWYYDLNRKWPIHGNRCYEKNTIVSAASNWLGDNYNQSKLIMTKEGIDQDELINDSSALRLLRNPFPDQGKSYRDIFNATIRDYKACGNAVWFIFKDASNQPIAIWNQPWNSVTPVKDDPSTNRLVDKYVYRMKGKTSWIDASNVVHFRDGIDLDDVKIGYCRLDAVKNDIRLIDIAQCYNLNVMTNGGAARMFVPESPEPLLPSEMLDIQKEFDNAVHFRNAGKYGVASKPGRIEQVGSGPQELGVESLLDRPESNICATLGVNPMVLGLFVGAQMRSYANQQEGQEQSWVNGMIPMNETFADTLTSQFWPMFADYDPAIVFGFDYTDVKALSRFINEAQDQAIKLMSAGIIDLDEARSLSGYNVQSETKHVFMFKNSVPIMKALKISAA